VELAVGKTITLVGKIITLVMIAVSVVLCVPLANIYFALLINAPNQSARPVAFFPWLLLIGTWFAVWLQWRAERWLIACLLLAILLGIVGYGWLTLELP